MFLDRFDATTAWTSSLFAERGRKATTSPGLTRAEGMSAL
jgi:hypothetical protein